MSGLGDYFGTETLYSAFCTVTTTGAPTTLSGTPKLRAYKNGSTTESSDITPTVDFDSRTGLNAYNIDLTGDSGFYVAGDYQVVITAGTVGGTSVVGYVVDTFSIKNRSALRPTTGGRTLDVSATGEGGVDWANVGSPTTTLALTGTTIATTQKVDIETIKTNPVVNGGTITFPTTATLASTTNITAGTITTATTATNLTNAPTNGDFTATMKTSIGTAVAASAVASVTGNVGGNVTGSVGSVVGAVGSVTGAVGSVTGNVGGNVNGNVVGSVGSLTTNNDKTGYAIGVGGIASTAFAANAIDAAALATTAVNEIRDAIFARAFAAAYGSFTFAELTEIALAALAGVSSGLATTTATYRNLNDSADVIVATVDADGNRSAVTLTP